MAEATPKRGPGRPPKVVSNSAPSDDAKAAAQVSIEDVHEALQDLAETPEPLPIPSRIVMYHTSAGTFRPAIVIGKDDEAGTLELVLFNKTNGAVYVGDVKQGNERGEWQW